MNLLCRQCQNKIDDLGLPAASIYNLIMEKELEGSFIFYDQSWKPDLLETIVKYLERKNLIFTSEVSQSEIKIRWNSKILTYHEDIEKFCFCSDSSHFKFNIENEYSMPDDDELDDIC